MSKTRSELLAELEAAALDYGAKYAAYSAAFDKHREADKPFPRELEPETQQAVTASCIAGNVLDAAASALHAFDAALTSATPLALPVAV
jgi:hypothetical protein